VGPYEFLNIEVLVPQWLIVINAILHDEHLKGGSVIPRREFLKTARPDIYLQP
jgi:hypothetical protein